MNILNYLNFFVKLVAYKLKITKVFFKHGRYFRGILVDIDYFKPYVFYLMAKSYYSCLTPYEEIVYKQARVEHNNSGLDHWEHYVNNSEDLQYLNKYDVYLTGVVGEELVALTSYEDSKLRKDDAKTFLALFQCGKDGEGNAKLSNFSLLVKRALNRKVCRGYVNMEATYFKIMIERWGIEGDVESKVNKLLSGDYSVDTSRLDLYYNTLNS